MLPRLMLGNHLGSILGKVLLPRPLLVPERMRRASRTVAVLYRCSVRAWLKLAQNHIYVVPQNQGMTMNANAESKAAPKVINGRINGKFAPGYSGNPGGSPEAARKALNKDTILEMHRAFKLGGRKAIEKVMRNQPAVFLKLLVLLVPREMQVEQTGGVKAMTEDQIVDAIAAIEGYLARRSGEASKVIEGTAEPAALPAPARKTKR